MKKEQIWIWDHKRSKFRQVDKSRCDFSCTHWVEGRVKFFFRKDDWTAVEWGNTYEECWDRATYHQRAAIQKLMDEAKKIADRIISIYGERPEEKRSIS